MEFKEKKRWPFLGLPWTFTTYTITADYITINAGFIRRQEDDAYMYKIIDVRLEESLMERIFGLGTVCCYGGDVTDSTLILHHIKNAKKIKNFILSASEEQRLKKRTLNTQDVAGTFDGGHMDVNCDCGDSHF